MGRRTLLPVLVILSGVLLSRGQILINIDRNGTISWNNPANGADRYSVYAATGLSVSGGTRISADYFPAAAVQERFTFSPPGLFTTNPTPLFFWIQGAGNSGETCPGAELLPANLDASHTTIGYSNDVTSYSAPGFADMHGPDRFYLARIPGRNRLGLSVTPDAAFDPSLLAFAPTNCGAVDFPVMMASNTAAAGLAEQLSIANTNLSAQALLEVIVSVDSAAGGGGNYHVSARTISLFPGDQASIAVPLTLPAVTNGTLLNYLRDFTNAACQAQSGSGPDGFYALTLAPTTRLSVAVSAVGGDLDMMLALYLVDSGSNAFTCAGSIDATTSGGTEQLNYYNAGHTPLPMIIRVASFSTLSSSFGYTLSADAAAPPPGDDVNQPLLISASGNYPGSMTGYVNQASGQFLKPDRYYLATVPAGERIAAILYPTGFVGSVNLLSLPASPATASVLVASHAIFTQNYPKSSAWLNTNNFSTNVLVNVAKEDSASGMQFGLSVEIGLPPSGEIPADATALTSGVAVSATTLGWINSVIGYPSAYSGLQGNDRFFKITVPEGLRLSVGASNTLFSPVIHLLDGAAASSNQLNVLEGNGSAVFESGAAFWDNTNALPYDVVIGVDAFATSEGGTFTIQATHAPLNPGERMPNAQMLTSSTSINASTTGYYDDIPAYDMPLGAGREPAPAADRFYRATVPPGERIAATLTPVNWDAAVALIEPVSLDGTNGSALALADLGSTNQTESVAWLNPASTNRDVLVAIDGYRAREAGNFSLDVAIGPLPAGELPSAPEANAGTGTVSGSTSGFFDNLSGYPGFPSLPGADRFYSVSVPSGSRLLAIVSNQNFDAAVAVLDRDAFAGGVTQVLAYADQSFAVAGSESVIYFNSATSTINALIAVDARGNGGNYSLTMIVSSLPEGEVPLIAQVLSGTVATSGTTVAYVDDVAIYPGMAISNCPGPDRFYRVAVPAGERITAVVSPTNFNAAVVLLDAASLDPSTLLALAATDGSFSGGAIDATGWDNTNAASLDMLIAVDGVGSSQAGHFGLDVRVGAPQSGDLLAQPFPLAGTGVISGTTGGFMDDLRLYSGATILPGMDRFYSVDVPTNTRLVLSFTNRFFDGTMAVLDGSSAASNTVELLKASRNPPNPALVETLTWPNTSATDPRFAVIAIDAPVTNAAGNFSMQVGFAAIQPGDVPENAIFLASGSSFTGSTFGTSFYDDLYDYGLDSFTNLIYPDRFFRVTVPPGERLLATVGPDVNRGFDASIFILDPAQIGATGFTALAAANSTTVTTATEHVGWDNLSTSNRDVLIAIDSSSILSTAGNFRVSALCGPRPSGDLPADAEVLSAFPYTSSATTTGYIHDVRSYAQYDTEDGVDRFYRVTIPPAERLFATVTSTNIDLIFYLLDAAMIGSTNLGNLLRSDRVGTNGVELVGYLNQSTNAMDVLLAIETAFPGGRYSLSVEVGGPPEGDLVNAAPVITNAGLYSASTTGYLDSANYYGSLFQINGPDRFYRASVPPGERILSVLRPSNFDADLLVLDYASTIGTTNWPPLSSSRRSSATNGVENAGWGNATDAQRDVLIAIDSSSALGGVATLEVLLGAGPAGDSPFAPEDVLVTSSFASGSFSNIVNDVALYGTLTNQFAGRDRFYRVAVPPGERVVATVVPTNMNLAVLIVQAVTNLPPAWNVLSVADLSTSGSAAESTGWRNGTSATNELLVVVDGSSDSSSLNACGISIVIESAPPGESPSEAPLISTGSVTGQTTNYLNDITQYAGSSITCAGRDRFYRAVVPAGERVTASLAHTNADAVLFILTSNLTVVVEADNSTSSTATEFAGWINTNAFDQEVFIAVDLKSTLSGCTYGLHVGIGPLPAGETPQGPELLTGAGSYAGSTTNYLNDISVYPLIGTNQARDRFYRVQVPAGERIHATLAPSNFNAGLLLLGTNHVAATNWSRLSSSDALSTTTGRESAGWANRSSRAVDVIIGVDGVTLNTGGLFNLAVALDVPPAGDALQLPQHVTAGVFTNNAALLLNDLSYYNPANFNLQGPDWYGRVEVPAGSLLMVEAAPVTGYDSVLMLMSEGAIDDAASGLLVVRNTSSSTTSVESIVWTNNSAAPTNIILGVDSASTSAVLYEVEVFTGAALPGETPATAQLIAQPGIIWDSAESYANDFSRTNNCVGLVTPGFDRFYRVLVPNGQKLTATVTPPGDFSNPMIYLLREAEISDPSSPCLAGDDAGSSNSANTASYTNSTGAGEYIIIGIDSSSPSGPRSYRLTTSIGPP